jgi:hypothetical protein
LYDYGQGVIWRVILASSADQIADRYPQLEILAAPPDSMTDETLRDIEQHSTVDIDDQDDVFLAGLRTRRGVVDG